MKTSQFYVNALALGLMSCLPHWANAAYQDLNPGTYHEYFIHLSDFEQANVEEGDISFEDHYGTVLVPPAGACGMFFGEVEGTDWYGPPYTVGPGPADEAIVRLPLPGCGNAGVSITMDGQNVIPLIGSSEFVIQSWIAYWVDDNDEKIPTPGAMHWAVTDRFAAPQRGSKGYWSLELQLFDLQRAIQKGDMTTATRLLANTQDNFDEFYADAEDAVALRQRSDLGALEVTVASLENNGLADLRGALDDLYLCGFYLAQGATASAEKVCRMSLEGFKQGNTLFHGASVFQKGNGQ